MVRDSSFAANRMHQLKMGKTLRRAEAYPKGDDNDNQASRTLASEVQIGRLLIKQETKLPQERSIAAQNAAFSTARNITSNHAQKIIMKDWKDKEKEGPNAHKNRSGEILKSAANMVGLKQEDIQGEMKKGVRKSQKNLSDHKAKEERNARRKLRKKRGRVWGISNTIPTPSATKITPRTNTTRNSIY